MKNLAVFMVALLFSTSAFAVNKVLENIQEVCASLARQNDSWRITVEADGSVQLVVAGIDGEASFSKAEWKTVQQALKKRRGKNTVRYQYCVEKLTPVLTEKFAAASMQPPIVGNDRDAHGCIGSAGYAWCEFTQACERPWELAAKQGFTSSAEAFNAFCQQVKK